MSYKENPKCAGLPNIPPVELTKGRIVRIGDISDALVTGLIAAWL